MRVFLSSLLAFLAVLSLGCGNIRGISAPSYTIAVAPGQVRLVPGLSQTATVTLTPEPDFVGTVELSAADLGAGVGARFEPASLSLRGGTPVQATLVLTAAEETAPGRRAIGLQASGADQIQVASLTVDIPAAGFFTVITYRGADPANFAYLAYQDGDGPWTAVPGQSGFYRLPVTDPGGRVGVLLGDVCASETASTWISNGFFSSLGEVQTLQALVFCNPEPGPPPVTFDLSGGLAGAAGGSVLISANSGLWSFPAGAADYAMKLNKGTGDLVAAAYPSTQDYVPSRVILERGRDAQSSSSRNFDFSTQGVAPLGRLGVQRPNLDPDETFHGTVQFLTSRGQVAILGYGQDLGAFAQLPSTVAQPNDVWMYRFQATAPNQYRALQASGNESPGPLAPKLPTNIAPFEMNLAGSPLARLSLAWDSVTPAPKTHEAVLIQQLPGKQAYCYLYFGQGWHRGAARMTWTLPDLSFLRGFDPGFFPQAGAPTQVSIYQSGSQTGSAGNPLLGLAGPKPFAPVDPPGRARPNATPLQLPRFRLRMLGLSAAKPAAIPWSEYWSVSRTQTLLP